MLGEADVLSGQLSSPRSPPDFLASVASVYIPKEQWVVKGICAYVPQVSEMPYVNMKHKYNCITFAGCMAS